MSVPKTKQGKQLKKSRTKTKLSYLDRFKINIQNLEIAIYDENI